MKQITIEIPDNMALFLDFKKCNKISHSFYGLSTPHSETSAITEFQIDGLPVKITLLNKPDDTSIEKHGMSAVIADNPDHDISGSNSN